MEEVAPLLQPESVQAEGETAHFKLQPGQPFWLQKFLSAALVEEICPPLSVYNVY